MLSKSLIQFSVDGWGSIPSLLFTWSQTWLEEAQAGIKIAGRNINDLRYTDTENKIVVTSGKGKAVLGVGKWEVPTTECEIG